MTEKQIRITINPALNQALESITSERRAESPEQCVNEILGIYFASLELSEHMVDEPSHEIGLLRMKIAVLEEQLERKEKALSALVDLWEEFVLERNMKEDEELIETEDRASRLIREWYYEAERKDQSGVDGGKPGHI